MLLPEPLLPELPCEAELPDWPLPEAADPEPLPLPLWAIANAADTIKIARICNKRFISCSSSLLRELNVWLDRIPEIQVCLSDILWREGGREDSPVRGPSAKQLTRNAAPCALLE